MREGFFYFGVLCLLCGDTMALPSIMGNPANERIIGGQNAAPNAYPSAVSLDINLSLGVGLCGGTLINTHAVVTAAHCVFNFGTSRPVNASDVHVGYGSNNRQQQTVVQAREIYVHPDFNPTTTDNDIALLIIEPVATNSSAQPATIFSGQLPQGTNLTAVGWGLTDSSGSIDSLPDLLQQTTISIGNREECRKIAPNYESSNGPQVCTQNSLIPGSDTCQGDSGTGIYITSSGQSYLVGLTSYGSSPSGNPTCALSDGLAIYTHIYYYKDFIDQYAGREVTRHGRRPLDAKEIHDQMLHHHHHHHHHVGSDVGHSEHPSHIEHSSRPKWSDQPKWPTHAEQPALPEHSEHPSWLEHNEQPALPEHSEQPVWPEHSEQPVWPEHSEQPAWPEHTEQPAWPEHTEQPAWPKPKEQPELLEHSEQPALPEHSEQPALPEHSEHPSWPEHSEQPALPEHSDQPALPEHSDQPALPEHSDQPALPEHSDQPALPEHSDQPALPEYTEQPAWPEPKQQPELLGHSEQPALPDHSEQPAGPEHMEQPALPEHSEQPVLPEHKEQPAWPDRNHWASVKPAALVE